MDIDLTGPPLIATAPTRRADRLAALLVVFVSLAAFGAILPHVNDPSAIMIAFIPSDDTGLSLIDVITGMLLIGQFLHLRIPSLLVLACGYFFAAFIVIAHLFSAAEAIRAIRPESANPQTTSWMYILWHAVFPMFLLLYAGLSQSKYDLPMTKSIRARSVWLCLITAAVLVGLCVGFAIAAQHMVVAYDSDAFALTTAIVTWLISAAALILLYVRTRARRILDMWLCFVLFAWLLDILTGGLLSHTPYNFGWYAARVYGLLAAAAVLLALLLETGALYGQLTRAFTELQTQSQALSQSEAALGQAQKMEAIGQLTGGVAHDFNNLLTVIIGSLEMVELQTKENPGIARLTDFAMRAALKGEQLTKQLLAFSRRRMVNPEVKNPNTLIRDFDGLMRRALGAGIRITLDLDDSTGAIRVDPAQFESAILNLAVNARDAMDGKGEIIIATRGMNAGEIAAACPEASPGPYVMVALSDTGTGMDAETISRAFDPFFTTKPVGKGSGLGLSQVYGFAASSNGHAKIESAPGQGTTIRLFLPRVEAAPVEAPVVEVVEMSPRGRNGEVVLVVEDDPGVLQTVLESLRTLDYVAIVAIDAADALRQLAGEARIDALLSDVVMPGGMSGLELARAARRVRPGLNIVLASGYTADAMPYADEPPSGVEIVPKPYRLDDLAQRLRRAIDDRTTAA